MNDFYVYLHKRRTDSRIFYVGKGRDGRAWSIDGRNSEWIKNAVEHGREVVIVASNLTNDAAFTLEAMLISIYKTSNEPLVNIKNGKVRIRVVAQEPPKKQSKTSDFTRRRYNHKEPGYPRRDGVLVFYWRRNPKRNGWVMGSIDEMRKQFGGSVQEWQDVVDGYSQVGPRGWRLNLKKVRK